MSKGRKPKPENVHYLNGNPGKRKRKAALVLPAGAPSPPVGFQGDALIVWQETVAELAQWGVLSKCDAAVLEAYCLNLIRMRKMELEIRALGETYEAKTKAGGTMFRKRPQVDILQQCMTQHRQYMAELGLTPSSRSRLTDSRQGDLFNDGGFGKFKGQ